MCFCVSVKKNPPYEVTEKGYGGFTVEVEVFFRTKVDTRKVQFSYNLFLTMTNNPPCRFSRNEKVLFEEPSPDFRSKLLEGGAVSVKHRLIVCQIL